MKTDLLSLLPTVAGVRAVYVGGRAARPQIPRRAVLIHRRPGGRKQPGLG